MPTITPGDRFQAEVHRILSRNCGLTCHALNKSVPLSSLKDGAPAGEHLELDLLMVVGKCAVLIETTTQTKNNRDKIRRFILHCNFVRESLVDIRERFKLLGDLPDEVLDKLESITDWRYLYIGKSDELIEKKLTPDKFPESDNIHILHGDSWEYLKDLSHRIGTFSRYELFSAINIGPLQLEDSSFGVNYVNKTALEASNRTVAENTGRADLYLMVFKPSELLKMGRVLRYKGQPIAIESGESNKGYQRILIPEKLTGISHFISHNSAVTFPSTLTIVLSPDCTVEPADGDGWAKNIMIPQRYASIDIIDGQHRLFAYAQENIKDSLRDSNALLVTAIKFRSKDRAKVNQYAARTFVSINSTHTRVKKALTDLIAYDVLGDTGTRAIAAKILFDCTNRRDKALSRIFQTSEFSAKSTDGSTPIPTVSVVNELARIFDIKKYEKEGKSNGLEQTFDCPFQELQDHGKLVKKGVEILEKYFSAVNRAFPKDWRNPQSHLMCAKYLGGFVRLFGHFIQEGIAAHNFESKLKSIRGELVTQYHSGQQDNADIVVFSDKILGLPSKRGTSPNEVFGILQKASLKTTHSTKD